MPAFSPTGLTGLSGLSGLVSAPLPRYAAAASRTGWGYSLSDGSIQSATYTQYHRAHGTRTSVRLFYTNGQTLDGTPNTITVRASVEPTGTPNGTTFATGTPVQVTFGGVTSVTLVPGQTVGSDPVPVSLTDGGIFRTRNYVSVATLGQKWPLTQPTVCQYPPTTTYPYGYDPGVDLTGSGNTGNGGVTNCFCPLAVVEAARSTRPVVAFLGDSISSGYIHNDPTVGWWGYIDQTFRTAGYNAARLAIPGLSAAGWLADPAKAHMLAALAALQPTHVVCQLGVNDLNGAASAATVQANLQAIWSAVRTLLPGVKMFQTTITPCYVQNVGGNNYTTVAGQTANVNNPARVTVNDWIRTTPTGLDGYFELADTLESSRNSGKWTVNGTNFWATSDGIHPVFPLWAAPMAAAFGDLSAFVLAA